MRLDFIEFSHSFEMNASCSASTHSDGFTLVELLVVVGILAILGSLLIPSTNSAKQTARAVSCASNLRQSGIALQIHITDNGSFPLATADDGFGAWQRAIRAQSARDTLHCSLLSAASDEFLQFFPTNRWIYPHFGYNAFGAVRKNPPKQNFGIGGDFKWDSAETGHYVPAREDHVRVPSQMITIGESPAFIRPPLELQGTFTADDPIYIAYPFVLQPYNYPGVADAHSGKAGMVFFDCHVERKRQSEWMADNDFAKQLWNADNQPHPETWK